MIDQNKLHLPAYVRASLLLVGLYLIVTILVALQLILLPLFYSVIIAIVISPFLERMVRIGMSRLFATLTVIVITLLFVAGIVLLLSSQAHKIVESWPQLSLKVNEIIEQFSAFIAKNLDYSPREIDEMAESLKTELWSNFGTKLSITLSSLGNILSTVLITPVYIFMILYYKPHIISFIHKQSGVHYNTQVSEILTKTKSLIQRYLLGLCIEIFILAILNTIGLFIIGIEYAILLGVLGALLNLIPYLGGIIAVIIYAFVALLTKSPVDVVYVILVYSLIQFIDNNFLVPKIVGSKVNLNALVSIVTVIAGAAIWGVPGMFLAIPTVAILKLIFDHTQSMKNWGDLLGDPVADEKKKGLKKKVTPKI